MIINASLTLIWFVSAEYVKEKTFANAEKIYKRMVIVLLQTVVI